MPVEPEKTITIEHLASSLWEIEDWCRNIRVVLERMGENRSTMLRVDSTVWAQTGPKKQYADCPMPSDTEPSPPDDKDAKDDKKKEPDPAQQEPVKTS